MSEGIVSITSIIGGLCDFRGEESVNGGFAALFMKNQFLVSLSSSLSVVSTKMLDHRYERRKMISSSCPDRYNTIGFYNKNLGGGQNNNRPPLEFWTNGTTTLILNSVAVSSQAGGGSEGGSTNLDNRNMTPPPPRGGDGEGSQNHVVRNSLIAGSVAGVASTLACHPFDVIRTKMQSAAIESALSATTTSSTSASAATTTTTAAGPMNVLSHTLKNGGFGALYTGLALPLAAQACYKACIFTVNNITSKFIVEWKTRERRKTGVFDPYSLTMGDRFICGSVAGGVNAALFVTPVEFVRNQLIGQHSRRAAGEKISNPFKGPFDVIRSTLRSNNTMGILGLWRGAGVTVARDSFGCGCFFYSMELSQRYFTEDGRQPSLGVTIFSGAAAGLAFWLAALPLDTVKTWVQTGASDSAIDSVKTAMRERGLAATFRELFAGFQVAYTRGIPSAAITVTTYSFCYRTLTEYDP